MPPICPDDHQNIEHINYVTGQIHDLGTELYDSLMDRDHADVKLKAKDLSDEQREVLDTAINNLLEELANYNSSRMWFENKEILEKWEHDRCLHALGCPHYAYGACMHMHA